jgi:hypothetical protein
MIRDVHSGSGSRTQLLIFYPSRIPDAGVKKAPNPGSATLQNKKTVHYLLFVPVPASQLNRLLLLEEHESESILERQTFHLA